MSLAEMSTAQGLLLQSPHSVEGRAGQGGVWTRTPNLPPLNPASQGSGAP